MAFVPLFCESHYSPHGVNSPADLVRRARGAGYGSVGLCDLATMAGFHEFDEACREEGLRPIFGCRLNIAGFELTSESFPIDFLIQNEQGYRNLVRLLTEYHKEPREDRKDVKKIRLGGRVAGLWTVLPSDGELCHWVEKKDRKRTERMLDKASEALGDSLAVGIDPLRVEEPTVKMLGRLASFVAVPPVADMRIQYASAADRPAHTYLTHPDGPEGRMCKPEGEGEASGGFHAEGELVEKFESLAELFDATGDAARPCQWRPESNPKLVPTQDFERGFDPNSYLFDLVIRGAMERYGEIDDALKERINQEYEEIKSRKLAPYLLLFRQVASYLDEENISRGVGRGRVVASVVAYCLGITRIDPLEYRLTYHPLTAEGESYPPMRIEIANSATERLIGWLTESFGPGHIAQIGRRQDVRRDTAIKDYGRWAGMTPEELKGVEKHRPRVQTAAESVEFSRGKTGRGRRWRGPKLAAEIVARLAHRKREPTAAPGKWTMSAEPLESIIPILEVEDGRRISDIGEAAIDQLGGLRLEFPPHTILNLLDFAAAAAREIDPTFSLTGIPLNDRETFHLIGEGHTLGIPPLEGITTKCLLRREKPANILQLLKVRAEAIKQTKAERNRELLDELSDTLLAYQCAYFKARYPTAFYAGALSSVAHSGADASVLIRALRREGIEVLAPDLNLSRADSNVHGDKIRLGLRSVRRLGAKTVGTIREVRGGGSFNSLRDFCERMPSRSINGPQLQNLVASGACDGFGQSRAQMSKWLERLNRRSGGAGADKEGRDQFTLFDLKTLDREESEPDENQTKEWVEEWEDPILDEREKEALGFNLSASPTERFAEVLKSLRPIDPGQVTRRTAGKWVRVAGLIDHEEAEGPLIDQEGGRLVDIEGLPVWLDPNLARLNASLLEAGTPVFVIGQAQTSKGYLRLEAQGLWRLEDLERQTRQVTKIRLNLGEPNRSHLKSLGVLFSLYPGKTGIEINTSGRGSGFLLRQLSRRRILFCSPLYQALAEIVPGGGIELLDSEGRNLEIKLSEGKLDAEAVPA